MPASDAPDGNLAGQLTVATSARLIMNLGQRMVYPFLPTVARGLGITLQSAGLLITAGFAAGFAGPLLGPISDRLGRRRMMAGGMVLVVCGALLVAVISTYPTIAIGFAFLGLSKILFDPSLRAYLGDRVSYERRGRVLAVTELAWAGAILIGAPAAGWAIERWGWRAAYAGVAALGSFALVGLLTALPVDRRRASSQEAWRALVPSLRLVLTDRAALAALGVTWLMMAAHELLFVVYGSWMETGFGLSIRSLGLASAVIGLSELVGELGAGGLVDLIGKRRAVSLGLVLTAAGYASLPLASASLSAALAGLFVLLVSFEFTFVATLPLMTELVPGARATMMSLSGAWDSMGRIAGALLGPLLWKLGGLWATGLVAAAASLLALGLLRSLVRQR